VVVSLRRIFPEKGGLMPKRGLFVTFEGPEACGKSSAIETVSGYLKNLWVSVLSTRQPGGTPLGVDIRTTILKKESNLTDRAEFFLFQADRAQHIHEVIRPALTEKDVVICDRYALSSVVYQVMGRGLPESEALPAVDLAIGGLIPDLTVVLMVDVELGMKRLKIRGHENRIDLEAKSFHLKVHQAYHDLFDSHWAKNWLMIDTTPLEMSLEVVAGQIVHRILSLLSGRGEWHPSLK
jgi:dTMP kinase